MGSVTCNLGQLFEQRLGPGLGGEDTPYRRQGESTEADGPFQRGEHIRTLIVTHQRQELLRLQLPLHLFGEQPVEELHGHRTPFSVGVPGQMGVLSGMLPRAYSVTINWAPPASLPSFDVGPTFLVRDTLETCDSYDAAVHALTRTRLSTSVFFTVCGTEKGQACVIERTQRDAAVREMTGPALVQANHHVAERFRKNNEELHEVAEGEEEFSLEGSGRRATILHDALAEMRLPGTLDDAANTLNIATVLNKLTCQQMVFCPRTGEVKVA